MHTYNELTLPPPPSLPFKADREGKKRGFSFLFISFQFARLPYFYFSSIHTSIHPFLLVFFFFIRCIRLRHTPSFVIINGISMLMLSYFFFLFLNDIQTTHAPNIFPSSYPCLFERQNWTSWAELSCMHWICICLSISHIRRWISCVHQFDFGSNSRLYHMLLHVSHFSGFQRFSPRSGEKT